MVPRAIVWPVEQLSGIQVPLSVVLSLGATVGSIVLGLFLKLLRHEYEESRKAIFDTIKNANTTAGYAVEKADKALEQLVEMRIQFVEIKADVQRLLEDHTEDTAQLVRVEAFEGLSTRMKNVESDLRALTARGNPSSYRSDSSMAPPPMRPPPRPGRDPRRE